MSMRDDAMRGKNFVGSFANDIEVHSGKEVTTLVFAESWSDGHTNVFCKVVIPTEVWDNLIFKHCLPVTRKIHTSNVRTITDNILKYDETNNKINKKKAANRKKK